MQMIFKTFLKKSKSDFRPCRVWKVLVEFVQLFNLDAMEITHLRNDCNRKIILKHHVVLKLSFLF